MILEILYRMLVIRYMSNANEHSINGYKSAIKQINEDYTSFEDFKNKVKVGDTLSKYIEKIFQYEHDPIKTGIYEIDKYLTDVKTFNKIAILASFITLLPYNEALHYYELGYTYNNLPISNRKLSMLQQDYQ